MEKSSKKSLPHYGSTKVQITNKFIADLKRIAELDTKMTEYDELGRMMKSRYLFNPQVTDIFSKSYL